MPLQRGQQKARVSLNSHLKPQIKALQEVQMGRWKWPGQMLAPLLGGAGYKPTVMAREPCEAVTLSVERPLLQSCSRVRKCQVALGWASILLMEHKTVNPQVTRCVSAQLCHPLGRGAYPMGMRSPHQGPSCI